MPSIVNYNINLGNGHLLEDILTDIQAELKQQASGKDIIVVTVQEANLTEINQQLALDQNSPYSLIDDSDAVHKTKTKLTLANTGMQTFVFVKQGQLDNVTVDSTQSFGDFNPSRLEHAFSPMNKGAIISNLTVAGKSMRICNTHLDSYLPQQRLKEYQTILAKCYGEAIIVQADNVEACFAKLQQRINVLLVGDFNTRNLIDGIPDGYSKLSMVDHNNAQLDVRQFNPMVGGLTATMPEQSTYFAGDVNKEDTKRQGYRSGGTLDGVLANAETGVVIANTYKGKQDKGKNDHAGLKLEYTLPEDTIKSTKKKILTILENALSSYAYLEKLDVKAHKTTENLTSLGDAVALLRSEKVSTGDIVVVFNQCIAAGGAIQQLMDQHIKFVTKKYNAGKKSNTFAYDNTSNAASIVESRQTSSSDDTEDYSSEGRSEEGRSEEDESEEDQSEEDQSEEDQSEEDQSEEDQSEEDQAKEDQSEGENYKASGTDADVNETDEVDTKLLGKILTHAEPTVKSASIFACFAIVFQNIKNWVNSWTAKSSNASSSNETDDDQEGEGQGPGF